MLSILVPKQIDPLDNQNYLGAGWNYVLDYSWIVTEIVQYANGNEDLLIFDVGCGKRSRLAEYLAGAFGFTVVRIDRREDIKDALYVPDFLEFEPEEKPDIIYWASSIEHNTPEMMNKLYKHSMKILNDGGLFLATFAVSDHTFWQEKTKQTNLDIVDALEVFEVEERVDITYLSEDIYFAKKDIRENVYNLREKYIKRFGKFEDEDPLYIVGAIKKVK